MHYLLVEPVYRRPKKDSFFDLGLIFSEVFVQQLANMLITQYLVYTEEDLELWDDDPDAFANEDVSADWSNRINVVTHYFLFLPHFHSHPN